MQRNNQVYNNYKNTSKNDRHILITGNLADVIMDDFNEWLDDHNIMFWDDNMQEHVDEYIMSLFYQLQDEGLTNEEIESMENSIKRILINYCETIPF